MLKRKLIVTHHAPDLDAIAGTWLLKRFDSQHYANAKIAFVNPGEQISLIQAEEFSFQLHETIHVDTGLKDFDHHQPELAHQNVSAASLVYDHICQLHPEQKDNQALKKLVEFVTDIDHYLNTASSGGNS